MDHYDLIVIGAGPAGEKGAAQAAYFGKRVALVERAPHPGGAGINTGTVPSKTLRETALYFSGLGQHGLYGVDYQVKTHLTVKDFMYREQEVVRSLRQVVTENIVRHKIQLFHGQAAFEDPHTVRVTRENEPDRLLTGDVILVATGSVPTRPKDVPFDDPRVHDSDEILEMRNLPRSMAVIGAGVIGCEYTTIFAALGIKTSLIDGRDRLLGFLDAEVAEQLKTQMGLLGVDLRLKESVSRYLPEPDGIRLELKSGASIMVDQLLVAAGRVANVRTLGIDRAGLAVNERGLITVNETYQTSVRHIYAAGDVIGFPALASTSMEQARVAMVQAFDLPKYKTRVAPIFPLAVYTIPEISMAGETEETCKQKKIDYCIGRSFYRTNARGQISGDLGGEIKLVFRYPDKLLLGVHLIGVNAAELIHIGLIALQTECTIDMFVNTVFNYPSLSDVYKYAAYDGLGAVQRRAAAEAKS
ncbi:MAG: Si-specific NAD(P)(+) transhydrogenase [Candidatus Rokuibacteriota bacterium]|nr:MAG: Si-specific NAD(P)(+) transhydrogenase [Candidatus Rokubacteria bacterium]